MRRPLIEVEAPTDPYLPGPQRALKMFPPILFQNSLIESYPLTKYMIATLAEPSRFSSMNPMMN